MGTWLGRGRRGRAWAIAAILAAWTGAGAGAGTGPASPAPSEPRAALRRFDSLLDARRYAQAKALCTGQALRMFDFLQLSNEKMAGLVDSARSTEDFLEERVRGDWALEKVASHLAFRRPFLGLDQMDGVQAVRLRRVGGRWLVAGFQELAGAGDSVEVAGGDEDGPADSGAGFFPVSPRGPAGPVLAGRMRCRVRFRGRKPGLDAFPRDPSQSARADAPGLWTVEARRAGPVPPPGPAPAGYLAATPYLDSHDTVITRIARDLRPADGSPEAAVRAVYAWVEGNFRFRMGASLFSTGPEAARSLTGDCSEAAVLTASLLRARGVPSRVALGFAGAGGGLFMGHAWAEAWLGRWVGVDPALREYPAGALRLKFAALDGAGDMRVQATNAMLGMLSDVDVEIDSLWDASGRAVPLVPTGGDRGQGLRFLERALRGEG